MDRDEMAKKAADAVVDDLFNVEELSHIAERQGGFWLQGLAGHWKDVILEAWKQADAEGSKSQ
jgi:hypothetical protein